MSEYIESIVVVLQIQESVPKWGQNIPWYVADTLLMLVFVAQHTLMTTEIAKEIIGKVTRPFLWNLVYNGFTLVAIAVMVIFWKHTDINIWEITGFWYYAILGLKAFFAIAFVYLFNFTSTTFGQWLGITQLYKMLTKQPQTGFRKLNVAGIKRYIRFPHHTCLYGVFAAQPVVSTDYLLLAMGASIYLWIGSIHQDHRAWKIIGDEWLEYRKYSHILFPRPTVVIADVREWLRNKNSVYKGVN